MTFGNIGWHRYRCSLYLVGEPVFLFTRKIRCQLVNLHYQIDRFLPDL